MVTTFLLLNVAGCENLFKFLLKCLSSAMTVKAVTKFDNKTTHCHSSVVNVMDRPSVFGNACQNEAECSYLY